MKSESSKAEDWAQEFQGTFIYCECYQQTSYTILGGAVTTSPQNQQDQWVEEFVDMTDQDVEATYQSDFWSNLEDQWKQLDKEEHPWVDDFDQFNFLTEYNQYEFQAENELKSHDNCLEEGKQKLAQGDLPSAVLYFEAAAQQNPQNAEAWRLLGTSQVRRGNFPESTVSDSIHLGQERAGPVSYQRLDACHQIRPRQQGRHHFTSGQFDQRIHAVPCLLRFAR